MTASGARRTPNRLPAPEVGSWPAFRCRCGHQVDAHAHFRAGRDCSGCYCPAFRPAHPVMWALTGVASALYGVRLALGVLLSHGRRP